MKRLWLTLNLSVIISILCGVLFYAALRRSYPDWAQLNLINTAVSIVVTLLSGVAAGLFVRSVQGFKPELRRAYWRLCGGIVLFGIAQAQYPLASYFNATFWYLDGFITLPYLAAAVCIFWGVRSFAQILDVRTRWAAWWAVIAAALVIAPFMAILPRAHSDYSFFQIASSDALDAIDAVFITFSIMTLVRVRQVIGVLYISAVKWLEVAFGVTVLAGLHYIVINLLFARRDNWYFYDSMSILPFLLGAILLVRAGYVMVLVSRRAEGLATGQPETPAPHAATRLPIVDITIFLASLASKPQELDMTLDVLRHVTSRAVIGEPLPPEDEQELIDVCLTIESYLVHKEPLHPFSENELHAIVARKFNLDAGAAVRLWQKKSASAA